MRGDDGGRVTSCVKDTYGSNIYCCLRALGVSMRAQNPYLGTNKDQQRVLSRQDFKIIQKPYSISKGNLRWPKQPTYMIFEVTYYTEIIGEPQRNTAVIYALTTVPEIFHYALSKSFRTARILVSGGFRHGGRA